MERKLGSPPRRRGKAKERNVQLNLTRITPAWAGKRQPRRPSNRDRRDHPRVGGEKVRELPASASASGSPPRGRGKAFLTDPRKLAARITPAWAGKRAGPLWAPARSRDHPRVGGEKRVDACNGNHPQGSPPRGRGKDETLEVVPQDPGITPAWAGKSAGLFLPHCLPPDHPRVGGEKHTPGRKASREQGSPPRGRGKVSFLV